MKRFLCFALALVLALGLIPVRAEAAGSKLIALTFDDGPHAEYTEELLDGLDQRDVKVTFFVIGYKAEALPELVRRAYDAGHEIANHSWDHPHLTDLTPEAAAEQMRATNEVLDSIIGPGATALMRPPYGDMDETIASVIGMPIIQWSIDSSDWATDEQYVYDFIMKTARDGRIILCHDTVSFTPRATLKAIDDLMAQGYEFVTVSELFRRRGMTLEAGKEYWYCYNQTVDLGAPQMPVVSYSRQGSYIRVTMDSPSGAPIYYTTDGSAIDWESQLYTGSFLISPWESIRAVAAFSLNGGRSEEYVDFFEGDFSAPGMACADPVVEVKDGWLYLSCDDAAEPIFFTLDGSQPTPDSICYTQPVELTPGTMIRVIAGGDDWGFSNEVRLYYSPGGNLFADVLPGQWYLEIIDELVSRGLMLGLGNYEFAPDGELTRAMMVELLRRYAGAEAPETRTNPFADVPEDQWYAGSVEWAYATGVVEGYPDGTFRPDAAITRQEMAEVIAGFLESQGTPLPAGADCRDSFQDGSELHDWAVASMSAVVSAGLMQGDPDGYLTPLSTATRAQFATILLRLDDRTAEPPVSEQLPEEEENPIVLLAVPTAEPAIK